MSAVFPAVAFALALASVERLAGPPLPLHAGGTDVTLYLYSAAGMLVGGLIVYAVVLRDDPDERAAELDAVEHRDVPDRRS